MITHNIKDAIGVNGGYEMTDRMDSVFMKN